jgi:hypothetical protein
MKIDREELENLITFCINELNIAQSEAYPPDKAERTAAAFLSASMKLAYFISDVELRAKRSKAEVSRIEAEAYFAAKIAADKKITESALQQIIAKDATVVEAKNSNCEFEAEQKKYNYLANSLNSGHLYFRSITKNKSQWE